MPRETSSTLETESAAQNATTPGERSHQTPSMTSLRDEFRCRNLLLHHCDASLFYTSQWRMPQLIFVAYRVLAAVFCISWILIIGVTFPSSTIPYPYWAFLTNWSYFILTCHLTVAAVIACLHSVASYMDRTEENEPLLGALDEDQAGSTRSLYGDSTVDLILVQWNPMPWYMKFDWILYNINTLASLFVTIVFFTFLFPELNMGLDLMDFIVHGTNSILTVIELALCAIPIRLLHFVYPMLYMMIYVVFSIIYWSGDHTRVIYPVILDWNHAGTTVAFIAGAVVGAIVLWVILFLIVRFRRWVFIQCTAD